jgi:hypothetical protein
MQKKKEKTHHTHTRRAGGLAQTVGLNSKPSTKKKKTFLILFEVSYVVSIATFLEFTLGTATSLSGLFYLIFQTTL